MKFSDILALARQGYTPADIKELLSLETDQQTQKDETPAEPAADPVIEQDQTTSPAAADQGSGADPDAEAEKIKDLEAQIRELQQKLSRQARPEPQKIPERSQQEILQEIAQKFM